MNPPRIRIWHLLVATPVMAISACVATLVVPKDKPRVFALVWVQIPVGVFVAYVIFRRVVYRIFQAMGKFYRDQRKPGIRYSVSRILLIVIYFYLGTWIIELALLISFGVASLPIIILYYLGWQ